MPNTYPCHATLFKWDLLPSLNAQFVYVSLSLSSIYSACALHWGSLRQASLQWALHSKMLTASMLGMEVPIDSRCCAWQRAMDNMSDLDLGAYGTQP